MNNQTLSNPTLFMLRSLFENEVMNIYTENRNKESMRKQLQIKMLGKQVEEFINSAPYSFVEVAVLQKNCDDIENIAYSVKVKNFDFFEEKRPPSSFLLVLNDTWSSFSVYQRSIDDVAWIIYGRKMQIRM